MLTQPTFSLILLVQCQRVPCKNVGNLNCHHTCFPFLGLELTSRLYIFRVGSGQCRYTLRGIGFDILWDWEKTWIKILLNPTKCEYLQEIHGNPWNPANLLQSQLRKPRQNRRKRRLPRLCHRLRPKPLHRHQVEESGEIRAWSSHESKFSGRSPSEKGILGTHLVSQIFGC